MIENVNQKWLAFLFFYNEKAVNIKLKTLIPMRQIVLGSIVRTKLLLYTMNIKEKFGFKVKELREKNGYSIEYLANISNVDRNYISRATSNLELIKSFFGFAKSSKYQTIFPLSQMTKSVVVAVTSTTFFYFKYISFFT